MQWYHFCRKACRALFFIYSFFFTSEPYFEVKETTIYFEERKSVLKLDQRVQIKVEIRRFFASTVTNSQSKEASGAIFTR